MIAENSKAVQPIIVYSADPRAVRLADVLKRMISGAVHSNYLAYRFVKRDLKSEYSQTAFGMLWDWLDPIIFAVIFYVLMTVRVINPGNMGMPYATFVTFGVLLYATFADSVLTPLRIFSRSKTVMQHVKVPPEAHLLAVYYRILFTSSFRIAVMLVTAAVLGTYSLGGFVGFVLMYPVFVLASMSIGVLLAPFNAVYRDLSRLMEILLRPLRYLCPVMWILPFAESKGLAYTLNPPAVFIDNLRAVATLGTLPSPVALAAWTGGFLAIFMLGWFVFHLSIPVLSERA